jgi:cytidylate kinase
MDQKISVAIDGPGGAGKSTAAKALAAKFGFAYVDTGAIYRTIGLAALRAGASPTEEGEVAPLLRSVRVDLDYDAAGLQHMLLNGEDVNREIRMPEISGYASKVSALPAVRAALLELQREQARLRSVVMDGRDIGTVVLPEATLKVFLTADPQVRARRRYEELLQRGTPQAFEDVLREMQERDLRDSTRAAAPLKPAPDAVLLDSSDLTFEQVLAALSRLVEGKMNVCQ